MSVEELLSASFCDDATSVRSIFVDLDLLSRSTDPFDAVEILSATDAYHGTIHVSIAGVHIEKFDTFATIALSY